jgi:cytochrome c peroxidase
MRALPFIVILFALFSCKKDPQIVPAAAPEADLYKPVVPDGWPAPVYTFENNTVTYNGFMLGRNLFYEPMLSLDTSIACGNCHQQVFAFTNGPSHNVSHGVHDLLGKRNSPALFNLTWMPKLMWDGGVSNIENQPIGPIQNPVEMKMTLVDVVNRLNASAKYRRLFKNAFGDSTADSQRMLKAISQFQGLLVSCNSKYDKVKKGLASFTTEEDHGYTLFKNNCARCHSEPLFSDYAFRNNGLPLTLVQDSGRGRITLAQNDLYTFKTPSLRNLGFSAPYMHDGRFQALQDVLDFYTSPKANTPNQDPGVNSISLSTQEKSDLISFLKTLNDSAFVKDLRFGEIH